jgi:D-glycero-alpha-D-manno-heptose-7-phosphate kinase
MRISFAGGGTDVPPYPEREGGVVLSSAITRYAFASARLRDDDQFNLTSLDLGLIAEGHVSELSELDRRLHLLRAPIERLADGRGVDLRVQSQAPPGSGLGASSTIIVAIVGALLAAQGRVESRHRVAEQAVEIERGDLELDGGTQDQYAASFGGVNFIEFHARGVTVNQLRLPASTIATLEHNLLLCHLGTSRESATIINDQRERFEGGSKTTAAALSRQKELAVEMKQALLAGELDRFGALLNDVWDAKQELSPMIATADAVRAYSVAREAGAAGGKITGAGGGGYMLFYSPFERRFEVAQALRVEGFDVLDISIDEMGMESWSHG